MHASTRIFLLASLFTTVFATGAWAQGIAPAVPDKKEEKRVLEVGKWYPKLDVGLNLTQSSYSDNWKSGETGSVAWSAYINGIAEKQINPSLNWLNTMKLLYGQTRRQEIGVGGDRHWGDAEKSDDQIDLESMLRLTKGWAVDPYFSVRLETLFQDVTDPFDRTLWFNPVTLKESVGVARKFVDLEDHQFLGRFGFTARENYRRFFVGATGEETTSQNAWDSGAELVLDYMRAFNPQFSYTSRFSVYQPFSWSKNDALDALSADSLDAAGLDRDIKDYPTVADIDWQNTFSAKVTKVIAVQLYVELLYDKYDNTIVPVLDDAGSLTNPVAVDFAVRKKGQYKQTLGIGLVWAIK
ncbi:MAG TPA: DUF3078 domain-containing protein [Candidatus Krumholzibacteria bacterium]|nr:DUF3078 domain-containing protein [Candidatus Krumholzibacteria bacterium]